VDGALYWKAYALGKLGRRDEAAAAIAELRKGYAGSRWLDDAKALELELKQAAGQNVAPEAESDEELKLMAINGLMQSDPERAMPLLENLLKGSASPKVKRNTLFVLAQSNSPKAQALIEQVARGGANPDLQLKAITYMNMRRKPNPNGQILAEIYAATGDAAVKRAILQAYASMGDKEHLMQAARTEKSPELRQYAIGALAGGNGNPELWQLYQSETTTEGKLQLLRYMYANGNADKLLEVVRTDKDPKVHADAVRALVSQRSPVATDTLVSLYGAEQDSQVKMTIVDGLTGQRNAKALVEIARAEKDPKMKLRIVERLSNMKSKEATDYLEELLKK
jgi:HEAT repeat protein